MSNSISDASVKRSATATIARPPSRTANASPSSVATWTWLAASLAGGVGRREERGARSPQLRARRSRRAHVPSASEHGAAAQIG